MEAPYNRTLDQLEMEGRGQFPKTQNPWENLSVQDKHPEVEVGGRVNAGAGSRIFSDVVSFRRSFKTTKKVQPRRGTRNKQPRSPRTAPSRYHVKLPRVMAVVRGGCCSVEQS